MRQVQGCLRLFIAQSPFLSFSAFLLGALLLVIPTLYYLVNRDKKELAANAGA